MKGHRGNFSNPTEGRLIDRAAMIRLATADSYLSQGPEKCQQNRDEKIRKELELTLECVGRSV